MDTRAIGWIGLAAAALALPVAHGKSPADRPIREAIGILSCGKNHYILTDPALCQWVPTGELNATRAGHTATLLQDGRVLVAGGTSDGAKSAELYDPRTGQWTLTAPLNHNRSGHTATLLPNGKVLVVGAGFARDANGRWSLDDSAELFDPVTEEWTFTRSPIVARSGFTATLLNDGKVLVAGGVDSHDRTLASAELYDPQTESWETTGSLVTGRFWQTATLLRDGRVLVVGGWLEDLEGLQAASVEAYDPSTGSWDFVGNLRTARAGHATTLLADGTILISGGYLRGSPGPGGGYYHFGTLGTAERFDPATGLWTLGDDLLTSRFSHTATPLPGGSVLVTGGSLSGGDVPEVTYVTLDRSELRSDREDWIAASALNAARWGHTATILHDGSVLVVGGTGIGGEGLYSALKSAEIYRSVASIPPVPR